MSTTVPPRITGLDYVQPLGAGGYADVFLYEQQMPRMKVAVKVLKAEFSADSTFRHRFRTEARTTAQLTHPGIAAVYDYGETQDPSGGETSYLVMELVAGVIAHPMPAPRGNSPQRRSQ